MKALAILAFVGAATLSGCADPNEAVTGQEVQNRLERGVRGQGQPGPINRGEQEISTPANQEAQQHP